MVIQEPCRLTMKKMKLQPKILDFNRCDQSCLRQRRRGWGIIGGRGERDLKNTTSAKLYFKNNTTSVPLKLRSVSNASVRKEYL